MGRPVFGVSVIAIMIFQVAALFARSMLELSLMDDGYSRAIAEDLSYLVVPPILLVLMFPYLKRCKDPLLSLFRRADLTLRLVVFSVLLGLTLRLTYWATLTVLIWLGVVGGNDPAASTGPIFGFGCPELPVLLLSLGVMALMVPLMEEVIHRAFIVHALLPKGFLVSIIVSALLFALMHKPSTYAVSFFAGVFFAIQLLNYRTLWASMITHATFNAAAVLDWDCLILVWNPPASDPAFSAIATISIPVALAGLVFAALLVSKKAAGISSGSRRAQA